MTAYCNFKAFCHIFLIGSCLFTFTSCKAKEAVKSNEKMEVEKQEELMTFDESMQEKEQDRQMVNQVSPATKMFLHDLKKEDQTAFSEAFLKKYPLYQKNNRYYVNVLTYVHEEIDKEHLAKIAQINSKIDNIWTVSTPVDQVEQLLEVKGILRIEIETSRKKR